MSADENAPLDEVLVLEEGLWAEGPPNTLFKRMRSECPVHWSPEVPIFPEEAGFWSVTTAEGVKAVSHDWQTYSSELGGITAATDSVIPLQLIQSMFIGMDPPKHDRIKALFQRGFTPKLSLIHI